VIKTIELPSKAPPVLSMPIWEAYSVATNAIYVLNSGPSPETVSVISAISLKVLATITVGRGAQELAYNSFTKAIYVPNEQDGSVSIISTLLTPFRIIYQVTTVSVGPGPNPRIGPVGVAFDEFGNAYVTDYYANAVSVINTRNILTSTIKLNSVYSGPLNIVFNTRNMEIYVASLVSPLQLGTGAVSVISTAFYRPYLIKTIQVGAQPWAIGFNPLMNYIYTANAGSDTVSVINARTNLVVSTISVGPYPWSATYNPTNHLIYVVNENTNTVSEISGASVTTITVRVGFSPCQITFGTLSKMMYSVNEKDLTTPLHFGTVSVIR